MQCFSYFLELLSNLSKICYGISFIDDIVYIIYLSVIYD